jgi:uncharacterized repeat protein (TIGR03806 family)
MVATSNRNEPMKTSFSFSQLVRRHLAFLIATALPIAVLQGRAAPVLQRVANTTLIMPPTPPQQGYSLTNLFPRLGLNSPLCIASPPGETNRLFIVEKAGTIIVVTNLANPTSTVFMKLPVSTTMDDGLQGLAFHPGFATNRYFYVYGSRNLTTSQGSGRYERLSRFEVSPDNLNLGLTNTEVPIITQIAPNPSGHGGDLHFGPDGYLYVTVGDGGPEYDTSHHSQTITNDFYSAILRIDVDKRPGNFPPNPHPASSTNYFVPADNPFVGATSFNGQPVDPATVRTEFYAVGLRVPWRMTFDSADGQIYLGDVGQDAYEEVDHIVKGGNYGWAFREALHKGPRPAPAGFASIDPIHEYSHGSSATQGNCVIGGVVYRGNRLSQLYGAYLFADWASGNVWALRVNGTNVVPAQHIASATQPVAFGLDPRNGDVLICQLSGQIMRLDYSTNLTGTPLPPTLAEAGAFSDLNLLTPAAGVVPYDINVSFWSDGALKQRWFSLPNLNQTMEFNRDGKWSFPAGAVWIKHFELELTNGVPESRRRLETRLLVRSTNGLYGVTYRWDDTQTNAALVAESGMDESFVIRDGSLTRTQVWHYPGRAECLNCHTEAGGGILGFTTAQLNRDLNYGGIVTNQILALSQAGYFATNVTGVYTMPALVPPTNQAVSLETRVRSFLAANCAQCHQPGGPTVATMDARFSTSTANAGLINGLLIDNRGNDQNRVIRPGSPALSVLLQRVSSRGSDQMPPLGTTVVDTNAVQLLTDWVNTDALTFQSFSDWQVAQFGDPLLPQAAADADPDGDGASNYLEFLVDTDPHNGSDGWRITAQPGNGTAQIHFRQAARRGFEVQTTTTVDDPTSWVPLDVPSNRPFFSATNFEAVVEDPIVQAPKFYRVRVYEQ